jgi:hypothetical protein
LFTVHQISVWRNHVKNIKYTHILNSSKIQSIKREFDFDLFKDFVLNDIQKRQQKSNSGKTSLADTRKQGFADLQSNNYNFNQKLLVDQPGQSQLTLQYETYQV